MRRFTLTKGLKVSKISAMSKPETYQFKVGIQLLGDHNESKRIKSLPRASNRRKAMRNLLLDYLSSGGADMSTIKVTSLYQPKARGAFSNWPQ